MESEMKNQHTPGPWEVVYRDDESFMCMAAIAQKGVMGDTMNICRLQDDPNADKIIAITYHQIFPPCGIGFDDGVKDANTRLIVSAPDLLAALTKIFAFSDKESPAWNVAYDAIVKATGSFPNDL